MQLTTVICGSAMLAVAAVLGSSLAVDTPATDKDGPVYLVNPSRDPPLGPALVVSARPFFGGDCSSVVTVR
ncbi:hypothetical protein [Inquilinus limosus]|uniref:hypothetical protein n=1 Tax=Inquilinus limosus TaxID=171674 RepID=UPI00119828D9|nr:hypothetical protein [Inquilinus limosus]